MLHKHDTAHQHSVDRIGDLRVAFFLNLGFTLLEIVGGVWTNSVAILADATHDLGDSLSLGIAWYLERVSQRGGDQRFSYGYRRFSLLGALISTGVLIGGALLILSETIPRLLQPEPTRAGGMALFAILGILVNGAAVLRMRGATGMNARVVAWHLLEDLLGWLAVLVVSIVLLFVDLYILDPILSTLITIYVLINVVRNLRKTLALFLQAVPEQLDLVTIVARLEAIDFVSSTHHTHIWSMDGEHHVLTTHLVVDEAATRDEVLCVKEEVNRMCEELDFQHTTIEIEYGDEACRMAGERAMEAA
jgi:cobalt-zinc-cadmium efflux system protein